MMPDYSNWTDADEIALLRGRVAENSSLQAKIIELEQKIAAERARADDLADAIDEYLSGIGTRGDLKRVLGR